MDNLAFAPLIGLGFGVVFALFVARRSLNEKPVYSGAPAQVLHFLGVVAFCSMVPTVIATLILHGGFVRAVISALAWFALAFMLLVIFAALEKPASDIQALSSDNDDVWTAEKAKTSGL